MKVEGHRAVFLDRDGTVCEEVGYLSSVEQLRLIPRAGKAIRKLNQLGYRIVIITNQSGVARGLFSESRLQEIHDELKRQLTEEGARIDGIYYCPHHPTDGAAPYLTDCQCRKPHPGLLLQAAADLKIDLKDSYMVGDHFSDVACGQSVGATSVLVRTGHGEGVLAQRDQWPESPAFIARDLWEAVEWILSAGKKPLRIVKK
ncbi:MAG: D-glycero-beta-D-manno-heptose 1,7-bisphosphate 7-phosphatase [Deltaproteobacteria bacterium]|nr:D-glycero-beta-D-manno-heptose 1,7-bisphosphate 7-phosphatase [Deltaproteobacteria bacterium]